MPLLISIQKIKERLKELNFPLLIEMELKRTGIRKTKLSSDLGRDKTYLQRQLKNTDQPVSLLILMSMHLNTNLLEPFQNLLQENIRPTRQEKELQAQIADRDKQIADLKKEIEIMNRFVKMP